MESSGKAPAGPRPKPQEPRKTVEDALPGVYDELRRLAAHYLRGERPGHTLQPTALVHEAYLRMIGQQTIDWRNRAHLLGVCASMMRRVLVDHARGNVAAKRGGGRQKVMLEQAELIGVERPMDLEALDEALTRLSQLDERQARVVELRYFGGLDVDEAAEVLGVSAPTIKRDWNSARAWLYREITKGAHGDGGAVAAGPEDI
ncbi:MAG: sigma-70 family RNA polymerase sigma factor [Bryobacteraceae bacterium]